MEGFKIIELTLHEDWRGWLAEIFRNDESKFRPAMAYLSMTKPGVVRGPHEHKEQTDFFVFLGKFRLYLWDNRGTSATYKESRIIEISGVPVVALIPPGVVHAYKNIGDTDGYIFNMPDRLYRGWGRKELIDEIRYEDDPKSPFRVEG
ncbi:MAG: dTDP-4-dehydrorhamnose 3,5-epimerase family protein [Nitrospirota bacterium]